MITLPIPPSANRYWRVYNGHPVMSQEARDYKEYVGVSCLRMVPLAGPVSVTIRVYRARKAGDLDNFEKVVLDALQGYAYENDNQVVEIHAYRLDDKQNPRVEVEVRAA